MQEPTENRGMEVRHSPIDGTPYLAVKGSLDSPFTEAVRASQRAGTFTEESVSQLVSEHDKLIEHLAVIAIAVQRLRDEANGVRPGNYVRDIAIEGIGEGAVFGSWYAHQNNHGMVFPLSYAWQPDFEELERRTIAEQAAADAEHQAEVEETARLAREAHDRATYERLKQRFEPEAADATNTGG